ncbi:MAG TPA: superoxide dismutase [Cu-Zn] SodC [Magnetospirillum sp.]|nr:superoxide dismutase [Cu-Zn] SodC [Magnetospirillum sp.]
MRATSTAALLTLLAATPALAANTVTITMNTIDAGGTGQSLGTIEARDTRHGLALSPKLQGLPPGPHGIHLHQNGNCGPAEQDGKPVAGLTAGGHFDPQGTGKHKGPWESGGHQGDLPALSVNGDGTATEPLLAPHLKLADLKGRAIVIHAGADTYSDDPKPLGGGGARIACGVIAK